VNDFAKDVDRFVRVGFARGVSEIDGAFNAVTEAKFLREFDGNATGRNHAAASANAIDEFAAIMRQHLGLNGLHDIGPSQIDFLRGCRSRR
jgi:hypothetical protein